MDYTEFKTWLNNIQSDKIEKKIIGKSVMSNNIYAIEIENDSSAPWAIITGAIHAREHLSCNLICRLIEDYIGNNIKTNINLAFVPLVNPDGANIAINGIDRLSKTRHRMLKKINGSNNFSLYKSNARGVDLNNNFPANWETQFSNKKEPSSSGYYGKFPLSEPESKALAKFTKKLNPFLSISYHLKGEEIYFDFFQNKQNFERDKKMAEVFAHSTGYKIKSTQKTSSGGYKDWCVLNNISALTIELGNDKFSHPYPQNELENIYNKNKNFFEDINKCYKIYLESKNGTNEAGIQTGTKSIQKR